MLEIQDFNCVLYLENYTCIVVRMSVQVIGDLLNFSPQANTLVTGASFITSNPIGIGTYSPLQSFHLQGNAYTSGSIGIGSIQPMQALDVVGTALVSTNLGIGTKTPLQVLHLQGALYTSGNIGMGSTQPIASLDVSGTIRGTNLTIANAVTTSNITILGTQTIINTYATYTSNLVIDNQQGLGPALLVLQKGSGTQYPVADFYDRDVSTTVPALRIADGANVGIGTATSIQSLHIQGNAYASGSIGIGSTRPVQALDVVGTVLLSTSIGIGTKNAIQPLHVQGNVITTSSVGLGTTLPLQPIHFQGLTYHSTSVGIGTTTIRSILHADFLGTLGQYATLLTLVNRAGSAGAGVGIDFSTASITNSQDPSARLSVINNGIFSGDFIFSTKTSGAIGNTLAERVRITSLGSIGIGTTNPQEELHITSASPTIYLDGGPTGTSIPMNDTAFMRIGTNSSSKPHILIAGLNYTSLPGRINIRYNNYVTFDQVDGVSTTTEQVRIDVNGNVGIGTASPLQPLHVQGNANIFGTMSIAGQISSTVATGTAPLSVASTTLVTNLNAGLLNSQNAAYYLDYTNLTNRTILSQISYTAVTNASATTSSVIINYTMPINMTTFFTLDIIWSQSATTPTSQWSIANSVGTASSISARSHTTYGADLVYENFQTSFGVLKNLLGTTPGAGTAYRTNILGWAQNSSGATTTIEFRFRSGATTTTTTITRIALNVYRDVGDTGF